jgi:hypothetical protein
MPFITFEGFNFTVIVDGNGEPWWIIVNFNLVLLHYCLLLKNNFQAKP